MQTITSKSAVPSAFALGQTAGTRGSETVNPFLPGSAEHNNFEVGRRFGVRIAGAPTAGLVSDFYHRLD